MGKTDKWLAVTFESKETLEKPDPLSEIKRLEIFQDSPVLIIPQLSVAGITKEQYEAILQLSK